jgi:hypothetical protein
MSAAFVGSHVAERPSCAKISARRPSLWNRLQKVITRARTRQFERDAAAYLEAHGGRLTDQLERHILDQAAGLNRHGPEF